MAILRRNGLLTIMLCGLLAANAPGGATDSERVSDTWRLEDLYASVADWGKTKSSIEKDLGKIDECKGHRGESAKRLADCMDRMAATLKDLSRFYSYASMGSDQDTRVQEALGRSQAAGLLFTKYSEATSFLDPELLAIGETELAGFLEAEPGLRDYRFYIENTLRRAQHTLSEEGESVIAATGNVTRAPSEIYSTLANAEIDWPTITLSDGTEARLDQAGYGKYRQVANRDDRKKVFDAYWGTWKKYERTVGTMLNAAVNAHGFRANVRKYKSSLRSAIDDANIPEAVYRTLIAETNKNLDTLHRYFKLRARMLGIDDLRYYDVYPPLIELDRKFPLDEGKEITLAAFAPMGEEYVGVVRKGFDARWMDAYPRPGKQSGAYMSGSAYDVHPYVLMNYNDDYGSVSTLAHEWGHALHSYLASRAQPYPTARYSTFTAEIASTFNEALLLEHVLKIARNDDERLFYLGNQLEDMRGTFFRQTMFAEYELAIHEEVEKGAPLTGQKLTEMYAGLLKKHHGHDQGVLTIDDAYAVEWAAIPHFYYNFYVYQYATSLAASSLLAEGVLSGRDGALEKYVALLEAGGSDYAYDLLKRAGVDMATPAPYRATFTRMNRIMDRIEEILDARG